VEGKSVIYVGRWADAKRERLPELAAELVNLKVDAILTQGSGAAEGAKTATATVPIIMVSGGGNAVAAGLVASLARPGGNVTGISDDPGRLAAKRMEILKEAVPNAQRMAIIWNAGDNAMTVRYREVETAARTLSMKVQAFGVRAQDDFEVVFATMTRERPDALYLVADTLTNRNRKSVLDFCNTSRIPAIFETSSFVEEGGLMSYGMSLGERFAIVARLLDRVLKGAKPADLPVEQPMTYDLVVNLKTAKALGLALPPGIMVRATQVIQ
jgi:putative ABC transport system substrate-binding protein